MASRSSVDLSHLYWAVVVAMIPMRVVQVIVDQVVDVIAVRHGRVAA